MEDLIRKIYRVFDPDPLTTEEENLYVDLNDVRGSSGFVSKLVNNINLSDEKTCQIVTGHRGSGKTTELRRLQKELESKKFFVVFCEILQDIDPEDIDFPDVLIGIVRNVAEQLRNKADIELKPGYFEDRWENIKGLLGREIDFESVSLDVGMLKLGTKIKGSPKVRQEIRKALEPDTSNWLQAANDIIGKAKLELQKKGYSDIVVIVDDLDKIVLKPHPKADCTMGEYLFINRQAQMNGFECHMVYTIPIAQAYSSKERVISNLYGIKSIPVVPMTKIKTGDEKTHTPGFDKFVELVNKRLESIEANIDNVFDSTKTLEELIHLSGGQPRELMVLIRDASSSEGIPITQESIKRSVRDIRIAYSRQLGQSQWEIIEQVKKDKKFTRSQKTEKDWMDLLDSRAVLQYINDKEWYDVNPLVPEQND